MAKTGIIKDKNNEDFYPHSYAEVIHTQDGSNVEAKLRDLFDLFYPVGSYYETKDADFDPAQTWGGTWTLESSNNELQVTELVRDYITSGVTTYSKSFGDITWADDIEIMIQLESNSAGGVGIQFNDKTSGNARSVIAANPANTPVSQKNNDEWVAYQTLHASVSSQIQLRCVSAPENNTNYRRIFVKSTSQEHLRIGSGAIQNANRLQKLNLTFRDGAAANRMLVVITAKRRMGQIFRYRRTA